MSKMSDLNIEQQNNVIDLASEHELHDVYNSKCSECYKFALSIPVGERAFLLVDNKPEEIPIEVDMEICKNCSTPCSNLYCDKCQREIEQDPNYFD